MGSRMRLSAVSMSLVCAVLASAAVRAQSPPLKGNPERGKQISYTCLGCHGIKGYRNAYPNYEVPKLEGQHPEYLLAALQEYKSGERSHTTMHAQASSLSDQDMADIAVYFAGKPLEATLAPAAPTPPSEPSPPAAAAVCVACHGRNGIGIVAQYPTLAGQHPDYIARALQEYRTGARKNPVMAGMAAQVKDTDIDTLTRYYGSMHPSLETLERPIFAESH
jgi:cytochrome c553